MDQFADASPESRRSVKRRPRGRSPELPPKAGGGWEEREAELIRRVEELEAAAARLRGEKEAAEETARGLQEELEAERSSAETATSEAMLMIERLKREKATAQMEARQFRRYADREREVQDELAALSDLAASYHSRLQSHGIDPDSFSDEEEGLYEEQREQELQVDMATLEEGNVDDFSNGMEVKPMVVHQMEGQSAPVEKEFEYTVDVRYASPKMAAMELVGDVATNAESLYARVDALEADRAAMRRETAALRVERAQPVMAREMARRLCREVIAEQKSIVKKAAAPVRSFSIVGICKWVLSIIFWKRSSTVRYTFGLSTTFLGILVLLDRSTMLSPWRHLPRPER